MNWYFEALRKYAVFSGRARRREYWTFLLANVTIEIILGALEASLSPSGEGIVLPSLYYLAVLIPSIAVVVRRLHDTGRSGWWLLISLIPLIGAVVLLIFMLEDSQRGENQYGPNPKAPEDRVHDVWECAVCGHYLAYDDNQCPRCGSTLRRHRAGSQPPAPQSPGRPSGAGGTGVKKSLWILAAIVTTTLLLARAAKVREERARQERLAELREFQRWERIERYIEDVARYQRQYGKYLIDKIEGRFALEPPEPQPPVFY